MDWVREYRRKIVSADEAVAVVKSGDRVYMQAGSGVPQNLIAALVRRGETLRDVEIVHLHNEGRADYVDPKYAGHFRHNALFIGKGVREAVNAGRADFTPIFLYEIPHLMRSGQLPIDVALIHVSPPDEHGFCSFGVSVDVAKPAAETAKTVIAEVNDQMPRTLGDSFIHVSKFKHVVPSSTPLPESRNEALTDVHRAIGRHIASLIEDGATLQMGIGAIPDAVLHFLKDKRNLGVHSEMFSDGVAELVAAGVINNERKTLHRGKVVVAFVVGSHNLYSFVHNNPMIEMHPVDYTNDPFVISQNDNMVAINSALQVDITGQVCADSIGFRFYSGVGGQVDFIRGAARSKGGKPIIALPSTAKGDTISRIAPYLDLGAGVVTSRADVHYVITEYGIAYLHGKTIRQRVAALINIAHPKFREALLRHAREQRYVLD
jgi:4-hydroxybutyrate CoA-transferase